MAVHRALPLLVLALVGAACNNEPRPGSPVGTWVISDEPARSTDYVTVSRAQSVADINAAGTGGILMRHRTTESVDGQPERPTVSTSVLRYLRADYFTWRTPSVILSQADSTVWDEQVTLDLSDPDSVRAVHERASQPGGFRWSHRPVDASPAIALQADSLVFDGVRFSSTRAGSRYGTESEITASGTLVFARRRLKANQKTAFGESHVCCLPWVYSMRFEPDGRVLLQGEGWSQRRRDPETRVGQWTNDGSGTVQIEFDDGDTVAYEVTVDAQRQTMTVVERVPCDERCQSFFASLLGVEPGTLVEIRSERTSVFGSEADVDALPVRPPPAPPSSMI